LDERLLKVFFQDSHKFALIAQTPITIDIYLTALYRSYPDEVAPYLRNPEPLAKLTEELRQVSVSAHEIAPMSNPGDPAKLLSVRIDERLIRLLRQAAKRISKTGRNRIELADFMRELSRDDELVEQLRTKRNLILLPVSGPDDKS
jgi:hypothetical protein